MCGNQKTKGENGRKKTSVREKSIYSCKGSKATKPKILFFVTEDWYFWSHRLPIARAALKEGLEVGVVTRVNNFGKKIVDEGFKLIPLNIDRSSKNPLHELRTFLSLVSIYRREKPTLVHNIALKPIFYGTWAAKFSGVPCVVNALAGLGHLFIAQGVKARLLRACIKYAFRLTLGSKRSRTIFQNSDDLCFFVEAGLVLRECVCLIKGSGVDTDIYRPPEEAVDTSDPIVVLVARMLFTKGVKEFVEAARLLKEKKIAVRMVLVGSPDPMNPASINEEDLKRWADEGLVEYWGHRDDVADVLTRASISVLPSYREGLPRSLIESASAGLPLIAFDVPGCREIVRHEINGLLVPVKNSVKLAAAIARLVTDPILRKEMGSSGREIVFNEFSQDRVVEETLTVYRELIHLGI